MGFFGKLIVVAVVIVAVMAFWRWWTREEREAQQARHDAAQRHMRGERQAARDASGEKVPFWRRARAPAEKPAATIPVEDMISCPVCTSFIAANAPRCQRADCPR